MAARGTDAAVWRRSLAASGWSRREIGQDPGILSPGTAPALAYDPDGHLIVAAVAMDHDGSGKTAHGPVPGFRSVSPDVKCCRFAVVLRSSRNSRHAGTPGHENEWRPRMRRKMRRTRLSILTWARWSRCRARSRSWVWNLASSTIRSGPLGGNGIISAPSRLPGHRPRLVARARSCGASVPACQLPLPVQRCRRTPLRRAHRWFRI